MKGSPAAAAGFKVDDIIVGVENNFSGNIQTYKSLMQNAGARLRVVVSRNSELIVLNLKVRSIL